MTLKWIVTFSPLFEEELHVLTCSLAEVKEDTVDKNTSIYV
jgi:hypothetical protein